MRWIFNIRIGTVEFLCEHGVGHTPCWKPTDRHGCDGCCHRDDFPGRQPKVGDIALCGKGMPGIIASSEQRTIAYPDGTTGFAWIGLHLMEQREADPRHGTLWSSRNPCILGTVEEFLTSFNGSMTDFIQAKAPAGWPLSGEKK